ncbi:MAG: hypothetical protein AAFZ18_36800 [Myxococcota bacterium]
MTHRIIILSGLALALVGCAQETIAHQQEERQANRILVLLKGTGIEAQKLRSEGSRELRFDVAVSGGDAATALVVLEKHNLPETQRPGTAESFGGGGMIPTAEQERAKRIVGVEGDIVNSLRQIPRVISVEAAVSIPEDDPLRPENVERPKPKASVIVVYLDDGSSTPPVSVEEVQRHVQAKLPEMKSREVNVLLLPSGGEKPSSAGDGSSGTAVAAATIDPALGCPTKEQVLGIEVCQGQRRKVLNWIIGSITLSGIMAAVAVVSVLRLLRYRREFTRLTAQFQQLRN